ncbi:hypothetical protein M409DRAFT_62193 [Zasmidium cellare ATCC 36951]|uniref:Zn(2)-C6 fungal-type domain-containing protein n=1 Tax=Zasmidium cellare ATCC 36951 TaxID=1080233 RepID=A0A6A6D763_ZASCE|nr:uncharacterized protein M409DRAFT_62193 [Zasmidium cellare ATCC 36951]KAF2174009.1 hypothetical protein M409DRAFT_62193 [Zasmidium cellare ATCC 36951]
MDETRSGRVRKRAPNACNRCRRQKIKCSGNVPCEQCSRRSISCVFDDKQHKILVSQHYLAELERQVSQLPESRLNGGIGADRGDEEIHPSSQQDFMTEAGPEAPQNPTPPPGSNDIDIEHDDPDSESEDSHQHSGLRATPEADLTNPLNPSTSESWTVDQASKRFFLGVSSNWSFGRRILRMVYEKINGTELPPDSLLFEGSTYDLEWDGHISSTSVDVSTLPTSDFALFLINAVKFHCGRLFHMFDETTFMHYFGKFYEDPGNEKNYPRLWYIHFLLILAFGKAFIVRTNKAKRPPGAELFVQAMQLLPNVTFFWSDPIQSIEILTCKALYLQCLDLRSAAYNVIGQASRLAVEQGMHTDMRSLHLEEHVVERCREVWWTVYILDRHMTSLQGVPITLSDDDITAVLPKFAGSTRKSLALSLHVKLSRAEAMILQTVYGKSGGRSERFMASMKEALRTIAEANDERNQYFPLDLKASASGICRLSAYLHIFHHQCLILATRPLLYSFLQKRLNSSRPLRVSTSHGARSLLRVCIGSAQQTLNILEALQAQCLLESHMPFDCDATFSSALVLLVATTVDPSLVRDKNPRLETAYTLLNEMVCRGNLIAGYNKRELELVDENFKKLHELNAAAQQPSQNETPTSVTALPLVPQPGMDDQLQDNLYSIDTILSEWNSEDGLSGEHLLAMADSLDFGQLNWMDMGDYDQATTSAF